MITCTSPAPNTTVGGEGETVISSRRDCDHPPPSQGLDFLWLLSALLVPMAQLAARSLAPAPDSII